MSCYVSGDSIRYWEENMNALSFWIPSSSYDAFGGISSNKAYSQTRQRQHCPISSECARPVMMCLRSGDSGRCQKTKGCIRCVAHRRWSTNCSAPKALELEGVCGVIHEPLYNSV